MYSERLFLCALLVLQRLCSTQLSGESLQRGNWEEAFNFFDVGHRNSTMICMLQT